MAQHIKIKYNGSSKQTWRSGIIGGGENGENDRYQHEKASTARSIIA